MLPAMSIVISAPAPAVHSGPRQSSSPTFPSHARRPLGSNRRSPATGIGSCVRFIGQRRPPGSSGASLSRFGHWRGRGMQEGQDVIASPLGATGTSCQTCPPRRLQRHRAARLQTWPTDASRVVESVIRARICTALRWRYLLLVAFRRPTARQTIVYGPQVASNWSTSSSEEVCSLSGRLYARIRSNSCSHANFAGRPLLPS